MAILVLYIISLGNLGADLRQDIRAAWRCLDLASSQSLKFLGVILIQVIWVCILEGLEMSRQALQITRYAIIIVGYYLNVKPQFTTTLLVMEVFPRKRFSRKQIDKS